MSTKHFCDYPGCDRLATFRIYAEPIWQTLTALGQEEPDLRQIGEAPMDNGVDTCNQHYEFTHPGKAGGGWWDDYSAPQTGGKLARDAV